MARNTIVKATVTPDPKKEVTLWARTIYSVGTTVKRLINLFKSS